MPNELAVLLSRDKADLAHEVSYLTRALDKSTAALRASEIASTSIIRKLETQLAEIESLNRQLQTKMEWVASEVSGVKESLAEWQAIYDEAKATYKPSTDDGIGADRQQAIERGSNPDRP